MIELKPIKRIMDEYRILLEKYERKLDTLSISEHKKLIGEVKLFWYRNKKVIEYFLKNITVEDEVAFLAGAVRLDVLNDGHLEYVLVGETRLINDPLLKMSSFYKGNEEEVNFEYTKKYLNECVKDVLLILRDYPGDFYILPIEFIDSSDVEEYYSTLGEAANRMVLSMFSKEYDNIQQLLEDNNSFEKLEQNLLPHIKGQLIFDGFEDVGLTLRDRCEKYLKSNGSIMPLLNSLDEVKVFLMAVSQFCMQALAIIVVMKNYNIIPFIRNDVCFQYFSMIFHSNIMSEFFTREYMNTYIPYVIQKTFDFSDKDYRFIKEHMGNGKMINVIKNSFEDDNIPLPGEIVKCIDNYMNIFDDMD